MSFSTEDDEEEEVSICVRFKQPLAFCIVLMLLSHHFMMRVDSVNSHTALMLV